MRFGAAWLWDSSTHAHREQLRARAASAGLELGPLGLKGGSASSETAVYESLGLPAIPPELREGTGEIGAAERGELPPLSAARTSWAPCTATRTPPTGATTCCDGARGDALGLRTSR